MKAHAAVIAGALVLAACGGDDSPAALPSVPPTTIDQLERNRTVNHFLDVMEPLISCLENPAAGCMSQTLLAARMRDAADAATAIQGSDIRPLVNPIRADAPKWADCVNASKNLFGDCADETRLLQSDLRNLHDAVRVPSR